MVAHLSEVGRSNSHQGQPYLGKGQIYRPSLNRATVPAKVFLARGAAMVPSPVAKRGRRGLNMREMRRNRRGHVLIYFIERRVRHIGAMLDDRLGGARRPRRMD